MKKQICLAVLATCANCGINQKKETENEGDDARFKTVNIGHCPYLPGSIKSDIKEEDFDLAFIIGPWMTIIEDQRLASKFTCLGTRFDQIDPQVITFSQSNTIPEATREELREQEHPQAEDQVFINMGRQINFRHKNPFIGFIEEIDYDLSEEEAQQADFDKQYLRYQQLLETNYDEYFVWYSCQESAEYRNKATGNYLTDEYVFTHSTKEANEEGSDVALRYEMDPGIEVIPIHNQRFQIFWRPKQVDDVWTYDESQIDKTKIDSLLDKYDKLLPDLDLKKTYGYQMHQNENGEPCNYDPYEMVYSKQAEEEVEQKESGEANESKHDEL